MALPAPGEPCAGCGRIPDITAPEIAGDLDGPVALAAVEAAKLRAEATGLQDAAVEKMVQADEFCSPRGSRCGALPGGQSTPPPAAATGIGSRW